MAEKASEAGAPPQTPTTCRCGAEVAAHGRTEPERVQTMFGDFLSTEAHGRCPRCGLRCFWDCRLTPDKESVRSALANMHRAARSK